MQENSNDNPSSKKIAQRLDTYDRIIKIIDGRMASIPIEIISDISVLNPSSGLQSAARESWGLLKAGIEHLKRWGSGETAGSVDGAVRKSSILRSSLAASLGILPSTSENDLPSNVVYKNGYEEAQATATKMIDLVQRDLEINKKEIRTRLANAAAPDDAGIVSDLNDPKLRQILENMDLGSFDPSIIEQLKHASKKEPSDEFKLQTAVVFNTLVTTYKKISDTLKQEINLLPPPQQRPASPRPGMSP